MPECRTSETLPEPWQSPVTGQVFRAWSKWRKPGVELVDWQTTCRRCGWVTCFVLPAHYSSRIATQLSVRWFSLCRECRKGRGA